MAVMNSTTGIFFGETAKLRPFDKTDFSAALKVLLEQFFTHLFCRFAGEVVLLISLGFGFFCCWFSTSDSNFPRCLCLEVLCSFNSVYYTNTIVVCNTIPYYTILYYTIVILYYTILYYTILYYNII